MSDDELNEDALDTSTDLILVDEGDTSLPSRGLLSFYDRLRARVTRSAARRGKLSAVATEALLTVPDVFLLLVRLALDRDVPREQRALVTSALAYFVLPVDLLPELALGPVGFLDDLVLASMVLVHAFGGEMEPFTAKHWSGSKKLRVVLRDVLETANSLVGNRVYGQLVRMLGRYGIEIEAARD